MSLIPGGDSYFGALLNSWIHVLMYSYYAFALLKIPCPWNKFLTQLFQFTFISVQMRPKEQTESKHVIAAAIQVWEMPSLFVLFSLFYMKSYGKKKNMQKASEEDQFQKAIKEGVAGAAQAVESAAKNADKLASSVQSTKGNINVRSM